MQVGVGALVQGMHVSHRGAHCTGYADITHKEMPPRSAPLTTRRYLGRVYGNPRETGNP